MLIDPELRRVLDRLPAREREAERGWRSTARNARESGGPGRAARKGDSRHRSRLERLFQRLLADRAGNVHLLLDASLSMTYSGFAPPAPSAKFEFACRLAAALGYAALLRHGTLRVTAFSAARGRRAPLLRGHEAATELLHYLETIRPGGGTGFATPLRNILARSSRDTYLVLLSDFRDIHWDQGMLALLHGAARIILVPLQDRSDLSVAPSERIQLVDAGTGASRGIDERSERLRHRDRTEDHLRRRLLETSRRYHFDYVPVATDTRFEEMLLRSLGLGEGRETGENG